ncbi:MAG: rod shape-determining protein, partial [Deltaproteobacteria bacterium]|nr:rod shape-determining protein [Deltaproteobacteria bacterium]
VYAKSVRVGGDKMDEAILQYIKRKHNLLIGERTAEMIKTTIGNAYVDSASNPEPKPEPVDEQGEEEAQPAQPDSIEVKGRDLITGIPKTLKITAEEVRHSITEQIDAIVETVKIALEQTPPELAADIVDNGIVLTGGGALLKGLDALLAKETQLPIAITEDSLSTVVLGSGKALDNLDLLKEVMIR